MKGLCTKSKLRRRGQVEAIKIISKLRGRGDGEAVKTLKI